MRLSLLLSALALAPTAVLGQSVGIPGKEDATPPQTQSLTSPQTDAVQEGQSATPSLAPLPSDNGGTSGETIAAPAPRWESLLDDPNARSAFDQGSPSGPGTDPFNDPFFRDPFFRRQLGPQGQSVFDPFAMMQQQMEEMRRFQEELNRHFMATPGTNVQVYGFSTSGGNLEDRGDHYEITLEITGLDQGSTQLNVVGNNLVLRCSQDQHSTQTGPSGQGQSSFAFRNNIQQSWTLPNDADRENVTANANGDQLTITIPKLANVPPSISVPIQ